MTRFGCRAALSVHCFNWSTFWGSIFFSEEIVCILVMLDFLSGYPVKLTYWFQPPNGWMECWLFFPYMLILNLIAVNRLRQYCGIFTTAFHHLITFNYTELWKPFFLILAWCRILAAQSFNLMSLHKASCCQWVTVGPQTDQFSTHTLLGMQ